MYDVQEIIEAQIKSRSNFRKTQKECTIITIATLFVHKYFGDKCFIYGKNSIRNANRLNWGGDEIGKTLGIQLNLHGYFFDYNDILYCILNDVSLEDLIRWYDQCSEILTIDNTAQYDTLEEYIKKQITN